MGEERRAFPSVTVTSLAGLVAGEDHCWWSAWYRAHHEYERVKDETFDSAKWRADHGRLVQARARELRADGYAVTVEGQNRVKLKGRAAVLEGCPDIVALNAPGQFGRVVDAKTGRQRAKDVWQVLIYMLALPLARKVPAGLTLHGEVRYVEHVTPVTPLSESQQAQILAALATVSGEDEPYRVPSDKECRFCPVAACPDRVSAAVEMIETEAF